jgi:hypothetical protein
VVIFSKKEAAFLIKKAHLNGRAFYNFDSRFKRILEKRKTMK